LVHFPFGGWIKEPKLISRNNSFDRHQCQIFQIDENIRITTVIEVFQVIGFELEMFILSDLDGEIGGTALNRSNREFYESLLSVEGACCE
jgi:hypothetical protein